MKSESGKKADNEGINMLNVIGSITNNHQVISNPFNYHFLFTLQKLVTIYIIIIIIIIVVIVVVP